MPTYNYKSRELIAKIVYYGPGRCGKTTNLQQIHSRMRPETRSELLSVATETDRTIYFDLLPLNLGTISGMKFMVRLFTVPGQVYYGETRKLVLRGADGVVFVADSQDHMLDENRQSLRDLKENLAANGLDYATMPLIFQYNKRDLPRLVPEAELDSALNERGVKALNAVASEGVGVLETLRAVTLSVFNHIKAGGKINTERPMPNTPAPPTAPMTGGMGATVLGRAEPQLAPFNAMGSSAPTAIPQPTPLSGPGGALQRALAAASAAAAPIARGASNAPLSSNMAPIGASFAQPPTAAQAPVRGNFRAPPPPPAPSMPPTPVPRVDSAPPHGRSPSMAPGPMGALNPNGPQPVRIGADMVLEEFKHLALMHSQMAERLAAVEGELSRLGRENQEIREILASRFST